MHRIKKAAAACLIVISIYQMPAAGQNRKYSVKDGLQTAVAAGAICCKLTTVDEIIGLFGPPREKETRTDGGMLFTDLVYEDAVFECGRFKRDTTAVFTLRRLRVNGETVDIGQNRKLILRGNHDLSKLDRFWGFQNVSLVHTDLRQQAELIGDLTFDSLTEWPAANKLPHGFDPARLLSGRKTPGLGVKDLHGQGVTGKGVGIAIIDQPLLLGHTEYTGRIVRYDAAGLSGMPPQMHGPPVVSIAVGRSIGVAPEADLSYFAVPMWQKGNAHYITAFEKIFRLNAGIPAAERIRAVSISEGSFRMQPDSAAWRQVLRQAEEAGIFVVTCDPGWYDYGILTCVLPGDPDDCCDYQPGRYTDPSDRVRVPAGNRTLASHRGTEVYTFEREGGRSWGAPYLAGLAALAFQVRPQISPRQIRELLSATALTAAAGPVVDPLAFIDAVRSL